VADPVWHELGKFLGLDDPGSAWYLAWSGLVGDLGLFAGIAAFYAKHNCHQPRCWRIGKHAHQGTPWCTRHHPDLK